MNPRQHYYLARDGQYYPTPQREYDREHYNNHFDTRDWGSSQNVSPPPEYYERPRESAYYDSNSRGRSHYRDHYDQSYERDYQYRDRPSTPEYHQVQRDSVYYGDDDRRQRYDVNSRSWVYERQRSDFYNEGRYVDRDSERGYGNPGRPEGGRNSEGHYGIPEKGPSNYSVPENERDRRESDYYNEQKPRVPYWKASVEKESDYNMLDTRSGHTYQMKEGMTPKAPKTKFLDTVPNRRSVNDACDKAVPKEKGLRSPNIRNLHEQETLKKQNIRETTNNASSGNKREDHARKSHTLTGNVEKQNVTSSENTPMNFSNSSLINCSSKMMGETGKCRDSGGPGLSVKNQEQSAESAQRDSTRSREKEGPKCAKTKQTYPKETQPGKCGGEKGYSNQISENMRSKTNSPGGLGVEMKHLKRLSALTLASNDEQDVHTNSTARSMTGDKELGDDCINPVGKPHSALEVSQSQAACVVTQVNTTTKKSETSRDKITSGQGFCSRDNSDETSGQARKCQLNTDIINDVEMKDDNSCDSHISTTVESDASIRSSPKGGKENGSAKTENSAARKQERSVGNLCKTTSTMLQQTGSSQTKNVDKGGKVDYVQDKIHVGPPNRAVGGSAQIKSQVTVSDSADGRKRAERDPSREGESKPGQNDKLHLDRQRKQSGESQCFPTKDRLHRKDGKRHHSETLQRRESTETTLYRRESTPHKSGHQGQKKELSRSQSDSCQEITPKTAQTYKEYREAKQREKEEQERRKSRVKQSGSERPASQSSSKLDSTQTGGDRGADGSPYSTNKSGQTSSSTKYDIAESSKFCIVYGADVSSPEDTGDRLSDLDIDLDESDDELLEAPSFLKDLENAITQPVPGTPPRKNNASPVLGSPVPMTSSAFNFTGKFSLDRLLAEHTDKPDEQREYEEMHAELKESVRQGGFVKDTLEKQDDPTEQNLLPEHLEQIEHLEMKKSVISTTYPGETIFIASHFKQLFTPRISPAMCGFTPGDSFIDKFLSSVQPKDYGTLLSSEVLVNSLEKVSCPEILLKWLIFLLSVNDSHLVMDGCYKVLEEYLHCQKVFHGDQDNPWAPRVEDILSVFINCGASKESVLPEEIFRDDEEVCALADKVTRETTQPLPPPNAGGLNRENLRMVMQVLALALQRRPKYNTPHLMALYVMLCRVALDKSLNCGLIDIEIKACLGSILNCWTESEWKTNVLRLCSVVPSLTEHHHNKAYLVTLCPYGKRGHFLQRRMSYVILRQLFDMEPSSTENIENFKIRDLHQFLPHLQSLVNTDMYKLYSCIILVDHSVGNSPITTTEKDSLQFLSDQLKKICGDARDDVRILDRSRVKNQMVMLTSKWTLMLLTVGSKQRSIFAYANRKAPQTLKIETVQTIQSDDSQSDQESDVPMEEDDLVSMDVPASHLEL